MENKKNLIKGLCLFPCLILSAMLALAESDDFSLSKPKAKADIEFGIDSFERKYYRPHIEFDFPLKSNILFFSLQYYHRINSKLQGEVDFCLKAGWRRFLSDHLIFEASLNHMCRHLTSRYNPVTFDLNEAFGRLWFEGEKYRWGFGVGGYLGGSRNYNNLVLLNFELDKIFISEFSLSIEVKLVNLDEILHELELSVALSKNVDFLIRNTKHYEYKNTTYVGMRFKADDKSENYVEYLRFLAGYYVSDNKYKALISQDARLEFFNTSNSRAILSLKAIFPILKSKKFLLGRYKPERVLYPLSVEYERKMRNELFLFGYCKYNIDMPIDVDAEFDSNLGVGIGFRNQPNFYMLLKKLRFEFSGGYNFTTNFDAGAAIGINSVEKIFNIGSNVCFKINSERLNAVFEVFGETGKDVKIHPFVSVEKIYYLELDKSSDTKFLIGVQFINWF